MAEWAEQVGRLVELENLSQHNQLSDHQHHPVCQRPPQFPTIIFTIYYSFPESDRHSAQDGDEELVIILVGPCGVRLCRHFDYLQDDFIWERVKGRHGSGRGRPRPRPSDNGFRFTFTEEY